MQDRRTPSDVFAARRARLSALLSERGVTSLVLPSGWARPRNFAHNVFPFRAESHFLYLVGEHLEGALLVFHEGQARLYVTPRDPDEEIWSGPEPSAPELEEALGLPVRPLTEFEVLEAPACIPPQDDETAFWLEGLLEREVIAQSGPELLEEDALAADALVALRLIHDAAAIEQLRWAGAVSAAAHRAGMRATRAARAEYEVRGAMEGVILAAGMSPSYTSIVSVRGEILHNPHSRGVLEPGQLLLADVGAETPEGWAGDITRTWPTSGKFSSSQRELYEVVLRAQRQAVSDVRPGARFLDLHRATSLAIGRGLLDLGILRGELGELHARGAIAVFFPHGLGHLLGLDVHDMEDLGDRAGYEAGRRRSANPGESALRLDRILEAGQLVTIEPGFYQSPLLLSRARQEPALRDAIVWERLAEFADVRGIRIEDDVLVTATGSECLTDGAPRAIDAIEALLGA